MNKIINNILISIACMIFSLACNATSVNTAINSNYYVSVPENSGNGFTVTPWITAQCIFSATQPTLSTPGHRLIQGETWAINSTTLALWCKSDQTGANFITTTIAGDASVNGSGGAAGGTSHVIVDSGTISLPSGASTSALQSTGNTSLSTISTNTTNIATAALQVSGNSYLSTIATNTTSAATAAKQPSLGTAGTPSSNVITVQGISSGTNLNINCASGCSGSSSDTVATGNISAANVNAFVPGGTPTANSTVTTAALNGATSVSVNATGTFIQTLIIQTSFDGVNYDAVADVYNPDGTNGGHDGGNTLTGAPSGLNYTANVNGANFVRVTCISYTSGTATIVMRVISASEVGIDFLNFRTNQIYSNTSDINIQVTSSANSLISILNNQTNATQKTKIIDDSGNVIGSTSNALDVNLKSGGFATAAKQPSLGTAGTASSNVITVQGIASMTALKTDGSAVTQPISAASLPLPTGAATSAAQTTAGTSLTTIATNTTNAATTTKQSDGSQKSQIVDGSGNVVAATSNALNVNLSSGGFATASNQTTANTSLSTIATNTTGIATAANQTTANTSLSTIATNTTGAATAANQTTANTSLSTIATNTGNGATSANQTNGNMVTKITNGTQVADTVAGDSSNNSLLTGVGRKTVTISGASTAQIIDMTGYASVSLNLSAATGALVTTQSGDNTTFEPAYFEIVNGNTNIRSNSFSTPANYAVNISSRYLKLTPGTSFSAVVTLSTAPYIPMIGTITVAGTVQPGNTANTTPWLQTMIPVVSPLSSSSPNEASVSTAYEASHIVKASAGVLYSLLCYNSKASDQFVETFNSTTLPADATVSVTVPMLCRAGSNCTLDFNPFGKYYSTGIVWSNSSTSPTKTIGSADVFCEPRYQ